MVGKNFGQKSCTEGTEKGQQPYETKAVAPSSCIPSDYYRVGCDVYKFAAVDIAGYLHHQ